MKNKLLIVYNICGISGRDNTAYYISAINSIKAQSFKDYKLVISSCMNPKEQLQRLQTVFHDGLDICSTNEILPVNVTFNHAVNQAVGKYGAFDGYLYIDSGCRFVSENDLQKLWNTYKSGPNAMASCRTSTDTGVGNWFKTTDEELFKHGDITVPVGRALNLHVQIFSEELRQAYGNIIPDIFASYCTESTFSFLCAAIKRKWVVCADVIVQHAWSMDGASSGFNPNGVIARVMDPWKHVFRSPRPMEEIVADKEGIEAGFGYEEVCSVLMHDPTKFDKDGFCTNDKLQPFIKKNLYLSPPNFNYSTIQSEYYG